MNVYECLIHFRQMYEDKPLSLSETALYMYLLCEGNARRWGMPIPLHTQIICLHLNTTKQNVCKARERLVTLGLITFKAGVSAHNPAEYTLLQIGNSADVAPLSDELTQPLTDSLTSQLTPQLSVMLSPPLTHNKYKDKEEDKSLISPRVNEEKLLSLSELKERLTKDKVWQQKVIEMLSANGVTIEDQTELQNLLTLFFGNLEVQGVTGKTDSDCRSHFFNWVKKQNDQSKQTNYANQNKQSDSRREVHLHVTAKPEDYEGAFYS